ncbi:MAG TPA: M20/M25/M40 family metallo-hydrolase [Gaiellaceae bacterium]|nr:M20/M25/M40 family metallo-hydrolase [Gaiellaceae bacterium]
MLDSALVEKIASSIDEGRLVETACGAVSIPSPTGEEHEIGEYLRERFAEAGLRVAWQQVEDGRPNVIGTLEGAGGGRTLMLNGHMDTSYSGRELWLRGDGFKPVPLVREGRIIGLGIANMKGALACYVEAVRALADADVRLGGDVVVAAVCGEIEKTQWGDAQGREYRGYGTGTQYLVSHGGVADMCLLGEPTEHELVLAHYGAIWMRLSTHGPFVHTAFSQGRLDENAVVRMRGVLDAVVEWIPEWEERTAVDGVPGVVSIGAVSAGFPWRTSRTPSRSDLFLDVRIPPWMSLAEARREVRQFVQELADRFPEHGIESELFVSVPGAEIDGEHELVRAVEAAHGAVFATPARRSVLRWTADSSVLQAHGIPTLNYGVASGLPGASGESVVIGELADTARVYALAIADVCGVV